MSKSQIHISAKPLLSISFLQGSLHFTFGVLLRQILTLVIILLAHGQGQLHFYQAMLEIQLQRHQGIALFLYLTNQLINFSSMKKQPPITQGVMVKNIAMVIGTNM